MLTAAAADKRDEPETEEEALAKVVALDGLIEALLEADGATALQNLIAENLLSLDQSFYLRLAARADGADDATKEQLNALAIAVMQVSEAIVTRTKEQMQTSAVVLQEIVMAAAEESTGEFVVPLKEDKVDAMRAAYRERATRVDEATLSNAYAWMRKAADDSLDGMVVIIQRVLQIYAGEALSVGGAAPETMAGKVNAVMAANEEEWEGLLSAIAADGAQEGFTTELQQRMERVVLNLPNGSYQQRVQAEFLKELEGRAKTIFETA